MATTCELLYVGPPDCDTTYAEALGDKFDTYQIIYCSCWFAVALVVFITTYLVLRDHAKQWQCPWDDTQRRMFALAMLATVSFLPRLIDPFGWRAIVPLPLIGLSYDITTSAMYTQMTLLVNDWVRVTLRVSSLANELESKFDLFFRALVVFVWSYSLVLTLLQNSLNAVWLYRSLKLGFGLLFLVGMICGQSYTGSIIFRVLRRNQRSASSTAGTSEAVRLKREKSLHSTTDLESAKAAKPAPKKRSPIHRIWKLLLVASILMVFVMIYQILIILSSIDDKYTMNDPPDPPTSMGDIVDEGVFDLVQMLGLLLICYFFSQRAKKDDKTSSTGDGSRGSRGSRSSRSGSNNKISRKTTSTHSLRYNKTGGPPDKRDSVFP